MDPYPTSETELSRPEGEGGSGVLRGRRCPACGSANVMKDSVLRPKPSIFMVILFGWLFLLVRGAFSIRTDQCRDCGAIRRYKSTGSWIALAVLIFVVICVVAALMDMDQQP